MKSFPLFLQFNVISSDIPQIITTISTWMKRFSLKMNVDKTEVIVFLPPSMRQPSIINGAVLADGTCIRFSKSAKNLGVYLDQRLSLHSHVSQVSSHCHLLLRNIRKIRNLLSQKQVEVLVHAIISSKLDYCNSIFYGIKNVYRFYKKCKMQQFE